MSLAKAQAIADLAEVVRVEVLYEDDTFWLNQGRIAELFGVTVPTVSHHLAEIYDSGELRPEATLPKILRVQREGTRDVRREIEFYNLDDIISVGYRVNSAQATQFGVWATQTLREFVIKGFVLDDERLKLNRRFGRDYFDELLERIREIRASERRFYPDGRRRRGQEVPHRVGDQGARAHRLDVPRLRRESGRSAEAHSPRTERP
jgi:hypothetical protein